MGTVPSLTALWLVWAAFASLNYAAGHPVGLEPFLRLVGAPLVSISSWRQLWFPVPRAAAAGAMLALQLLAAWRIGTTLSRWVAPRGLPRSDAALFAPLLGLGGSGLLVLGAGLCGFYGPACYGVLLGMPALLALPGLRNLPASTLARRAGRAMRERPAAWLLAGLAAAALVQAGSLLSGLTPPHVSDELVYHLGLARWYLRHHRIVAQPGNVFNAFPALDTMLYGAPESFGLAFGIKWIHWAAGGLTVIGVLRLSEGAGGGARALTVLALATMPIVWTFAGRAYNDLFLAACGAGAVLAARRGAGCLAGACVGLAGGFKYTGLLLGAVLVPLLPLRSLPPAAIAAGFVGAPWLVRNWLLLANPFHPLLWRLFHDSRWDAALDARLAKEGLQDASPLYGRLLRLPALPWSIPVRNLGAGADGTTGVLFALAVPALFTGCRWREALALLLFAIPSLLGVPGFRFLLPILPLLLAVMAREADRLFATPRFRRPLFAGLAGLLCWQAAEFVPGAWRDYDDPLPVLLGQESVGRYLDLMRYPRVYYPHPSTWVDRAAAERTPPGARLLFIGGFGGGYGIPRWCVFTTLEDRPIPVTIARESRDAGGIAKRFRQLGITHVIVNRWLGDVYLDYWQVWNWGTPGTVDRWVAFWDRHAVPVAVHGRHLALFALSRAPHPGPHRLTPGFESEVVGLLVNLLRARRMDEANRILDDIAPTLPASPGVWMARAMARAMEGRLTEARACCARVTALAAGSPEELRCRAAIAIAENRLSDAAALLERAARRLSDDPAAWLSLSVVRYQLGQASAAWWPENEYRRASNRATGR